MLTQKKAGNKKNLILGVVLVIVLVVTGYLSYTQLFPTTFGTQAPAPVVSIPITVGFDTAVFATGKFVKLLIHGQDKFPIVASILGNTQLFKF